jgi:hypothetical protein|tara:strand:- start:1206 stop:1607 length:402 start_codon:yes stop_codon:yes gene_type:complete
VKNKKRSRKSLVKKLDKVFSEYIRRRHSVADLSECVTCGKIEKWQKLQCGHFMSRKNYSTRWDEKNCQVQCAGCNVFRYGEQYKFGLWLDAEFGEGSAEELLRKSKEIIHLDNFDLMVLIENYEKKIIDLDKE